DAAALDAALRGVDLVFNCAGRSSDWGAWREFHSANVLGVRALLAAAHRAASVQRFVHVSTTDVYGYPLSGCDETHPIRDVGLPYNRSKAIGDRIAMQFHQRTGLPVTVVRPATVFGPESKDWCTEIARLLVCGQL